MSRKHAFIAALVASSVGFAVPALAADSAKTFNDTGVLKAGKTELSTNGFSAAKAAEGSALKAPASSTFSGDMFSTSITTGAIAKPDVAKKLEGKTTGALSNTLATHDKIVAK